MGRNMLVERWPARYFGAYRRGENENQVTQHEVSILLNGMDPVDRPHIIESIEENQNEPHIIAAEFGTTDAMAAALVDYVQAGGR